ncbi:MAG: hypothetical protein QW275_02715 [Candidatus Anstonellaceae archaeon]
MGNEKYGSPGDIESRVLNVIKGTIPLATFMEVTTAYFRPADVLKVERGKKTITDSSKNFAFYGFLLGLVYAPLLAFQAIGISFELAIITAIIALLLYPVLFIIMGLLMSAIFFAVAKILGGKGAFSDQTYIFSLIEGAIVLFNLPLMLLMQIPVIGWIFYLPSIAINLYGIYSIYRLMKEVHELSTLKSIIVVIVPFILLFLAIAIFFIVLFSSLLLSLAIAGSYGR